MPKFIEFKKEIKETQSIDRNILKKLEEEIKEVRKRITKQCVSTPEFFEKSFPFLYKQLQIVLLERKLSNGVSGETDNKVYINVDGCLKVFEKINEDLPFENFENLIEGVSLPKTEDTEDISYVCIDLCKDLDQVLSNVRNTYSVNQEIINSMDNEKIINYIDLERLLSHIITSKLSPVDTLEILGLAVGFDIKYLQNHSKVNVPNVEFVSKLSEYFNIDGTLKFNEDLEQFKTVILEILEKFMFSYIMFSKVGLVDPSVNIKGFLQINNLINEYFKIIIENNEKLKNMTISHESKDTHELVYITKIDRKYLEELKKYYRNNEIICIPEDMNAFIELLNRCEIDEKEKKYILSLIDLTKRDNENNITEYLNACDKLIYEKAIGILDKLHHTDGDYYILVQMLDDLKTALNIMSETTDTEEIEYLEVEISDLILKIDEVISKYGEEKKSDNTLLFLLDENMVPYVKQDSDLLDGSFFKMICNGLKKIRKDNQSNFRLVLTNDNISYRVYNILSSKVHLSFIELDSGVYIVLGCDVVSRGYEDVIKRVLYHEDEIRKLEKLVKNDNSRNSILVSHEQYLSLFNPDNRDATLKRIN